MNNVTPIFKKPKLAPLNLVAAILDLQAEGIYVDLQANGKKIITVVE